MAPLEMRLTWFGRKSGRRAMGKVIGWHPDKIVMAHGEWIRHDGMAFLSTAFKWLR